MAEEQTTRPNVAALYTEVFQKCEDDISQLDRVTHFDKLRLLSTKDEMLRLEKEKHTAKYNPIQFHYKAQRAMQTIQQQLGFYVDNATNPGKYDHLEPKKQIEKHTSDGINTINDLINPDGE